MDNVPGRSRLTIVTTVKNIKDYAYFPVGRVHFL